MIGRSRGGEQPAHLGEIGGAGMGAHRPVGADDRGGAPVAQHVLGQCQRRPGPGRPEVAT